MPDVSEIPSDASHTEQIDSVVASFFPQLAQEVISLVLEKPNAQVNRQKCGAFLSALNRQLGSGADVHDVATFASPLCCFNCAPAKALV